MDLARFWVESSGENLVLTFQKTREILVQVRDLDSLSWRRSTNFRNLQKLGDSQVGGVVTLSYFIKQSVCTTANVPR